MNKEEAIKRHQKGKLIPHTTSLSLMIWTDGPLYRESQEGGAAAIIIDPVLQGENRERYVVAALEKVSTSYETEGTAMMIGTTESEAEYELKHRDIHILSDSLTCLTMLHDLRTKPRAVPELIDTIATNIAHLNKNNTVHCHYVPPATKASK